jgi:hypothetical protein
MNSLLKSRILSMNLLKVQKAKFSNYNYHHDFNPEYLSPNTVLNSSLVFFDGFRVIAYLGVLIILAFSAPTYILFRKKKYISNPDYLLDLKLDK